MRKVASEFIRLGDAAFVNYPLGTRLSVHAACRSISHFIFAVLCSGEYPPEHPDKDITGCYSTTLGSLYFSLSSMITTDKIMLLSYSLSALHYAVPAYASHS